MKKLIQNIKDKTPKFNKRWGKFWTVVFVVSSSMIATGKIQNDTLYIVLSVLSGLATLYNAQKVEKDGESNGTGE